MQSPEGSDAADDCVCKPGFYNPPASTVRLSGSKEGIFWGTATAEYAMFSMPRSIALSPSGQHALVTGMIWFEPNRKPVQLWSVSQIYLFWDFVSMQSILVCSFTHIPYAYKYIMYIFASVDACMTGSIIRLTQSTVNVLLKLASSLL